MLKTISMFVQRRGFVACRKRRTEMKTPRLIGVKLAAIAITFLGVARCRSIIFSELNLVVEKNRRISFWVTAKTAIDVPNVAAEDPVGHTVVC